MYTWFTYSFEKREKGKDYKF